MSRLSFQIDAVIEGRRRLTEEQALELYHEAAIQDLGAWAQAVTQRLHPEDYRTYVIDRNINYTNVCTAKCTFCAFRRDHEDADSYTLTNEQIGAKIRELLGIGGTQVLMQGGMNDALPIEYYEDLLRYIRAEFPTIHIHAFSPPEFVEFERFFNMDVREIIRRFRAAGLDTIPGGGGEIFAPRVRRRIGIGKCSGDDWLRVMRVAHEEGMNTSCTMLIGHIEFVRERIEHMAALRDMQDYAMALRQEGGSDEATERRSDGGGRGNDEVRSPKSERMTNVEARMPTGHWPLATGNSRPIENRKSKIENPSGGGFRVQGSGFSGEAGEVIRRVRSRWPGVFARSSIENRKSKIENPGSYTAFIHWPFQRENTPLGRAREWDPDTYGPFDDSTNEDILRGRVVRMAGASEYLRMLAIARLFLDNIPNLQSSWVTMGPKIGQLALFFGANDMGSVMMEENVVSAAGTTYKLNEREICRLIRDAGWVPAQRDQYYKVIRRHDGPESPDLRPLEHPPVRKVRRIDGEFIGSAPGLDDEPDHSMKVQLPLLGT
jgi:2-iminoacetate synthase ThiH